MNNKDLNNLINELKAEGASDKEAEELFLFSKNMGNLLDIERSDIHKNKFIRQIVPQKNNTRKMYYFATVFSFVLLFGFSSIVEAQNSLPGDKLYPVKIASENIVSLIKPSFKNEIIKRRSIEIKDLSKKNNSREFHETVENYARELSENKNIDAKDMEESRKNLEDARKDSLEDNKEDLEKIILQTKDVEELLEKSEVKGDNTGPSKDEDNNESDNKNGNDNQKLERQINDIFDR